MSQLIEKLESNSILPVLVIEDANKAQRLATSLKEGGLQVIEVTLRTKAALEAIKLIQEIDDVVVGAGTVLSEMQFDLAVEAGAQFIVSPGTSLKVIRRAINNKVPIFPGVATATEIQTVIDEGLQIMKFFPAETSGGAAAIKALSGPFSEVRFIPTGGIGISNLSEYLKIPSILAVGGSWMVTSELLQEERFLEITSNCMKAVEVSRSIRN